MRKSIRTFTRLGPSSHPWWGVLLLVAAGVLGSCRSNQPPAQPAADLPTVTPTPAIGVRFVTRVPPTVAVVNLPTATPLPPPTATPSPTPIIYEIIEGDTILAIAIAQGTTTEEILALNPGVRPELLQIGAQLVLPPPATPIFGGAAATPVPVNLATGQTHIYQTASGRSWVIGELVNQGPTWVTQVQLRLEGQDGQGRPLGEATAWTTGPLIGPGQPAPFGILWPGELPDGGRPLVSVVRADGLVDPFDPNFGQFIPLTIEDSTIERLEVGSIVSGVIANPSPDATAVGEVVVTFYGRSDQIVGFATARTEPIPPGGRTAFQVQSVPPGGRAADYAVHVHGIRP